MSDAASPDASGVATRAAALRLLDAVLRRGQRLDVALAPATRDLPRADDRAFALAIASEALRWLSDLDALIDTATAQPLAHDLKARSVLRLALAQILRLDTPPHAAIATALPLLVGGPRRLVHGVLGTLLRREVRLPSVPTLPAPVAARWGPAWGYGMLADAARALAEPPPLRLSDKDGGSRILPPGARLDDDADFAAGDAWVQNAAAALPARLLGRGDGRRVLDLCAAPGGKTLQLAAAGWRVIAVDNNARRLDRLRDNLARTRLEAEIVEADLLAWEPPALVDAVLLDAPCSATGTFARHPDVLHRIGAKDIAALAGLQTRLLARAADWLAPGGTLVFATCSLEREEGEAVAAAAPLPTESVDEALSDFARRTAEGWVRVLPRPGVDGFFIARFRRPA